MPAALEVAELAQAELEEAIVYHERERPGTGARLAREVQAVIEQAMVFPSSGSLVEAPELDVEVRRYLLNPAYPYHVVATVVGDVLLVLAIAHQKRDPTYWVDRLNQP